MAQTSELVPLLRRLRLSGLLQTLDLRARQLAEDNLDVHEFLYRLLSDEVERRNATALRRRVRGAGFESTKTLAEFDFGFNDKLPKQQLIELAAGHFIGKAENVLLIGPSGVGKSHLAQAIGLRACQVGLKVFYTSARKLFAELRAGRGDGTFAKRFAKYISPHLLIIDDVGLHPLTADEPANLYDLIHQRYEKSSTLMTSNRDIPEWFGLFGDPLLASAAMDRLLHHCHTLILEGRSFRTAKRSA